MVGRSDKPFETRDDWQEAWDLAAEYRDAAAELGIKKLVTVEPVTVSTGFQRSQVVFGIFFADDHPVVAPDGTVLAAGSRVSA